MKRSLGMTALLWQGGTRTSRGGLPQVLEKTSGLAPQHGALFPMRPPGRPVVGTPHLPPSPRNQAPAGELSYKGGWNRFRKGTNRDSEGI